MSEARPAPVQFRPGSLAPKLEARAQDGRPLGAVASRDLERYYVALERALPTFSKHEAMAILDANNGSLWEPWSVSLLWANVADTEALGEKWGIDQSDLVARLRALSHIEALAVADACERFWDHPGLNDGDVALKASGLVRKEDWDRDNGTDGEAV